MAGWRQVIELAMTDEEIGRLAVIARSRNESASRVERAQGFVTLLGLSGVFCGRKCPS